MKTCGRCKIKKKNAAFNKKSASLDGLQDRCRECQKEVKRVGTQNKEPVGNGTGEAFLELLEEVVSTKSLSRKERLEAVRLLVGMLKEK